MHVVQVVRDADDRWGTRTCFDSVNKMQIIMQKASTSDYIGWCFGAIYDLFSQGDFGSGFSIRVLQGDRNQRSLIEILKEKHTFLLWVVKQYMNTLPLPADQKSTIADVCMNGHAHHRRFCGGTRSGIQTQWQFMSCGFLTEVDTVFRGRLLCCTIVPSVRQVEDPKCDPREP